MYSDDVRYRSHLQKKFHGDLDCFHMTAKCVFLIAIQDAHLELRSVHTVEVIAYFELRSIHTSASDRNLDVGFQREKNIWVPCQSNMHGARISCASVHMQRAVYRRKWLEGHTSSAPQNTI